MPDKEKMRSEDQVSCVLYDKDGNVKETSKSKKNVSRLEKLIKIINKLMEIW